MTRHHSGTHFLQVPGPTNVPDRVLRAMDRAVIDHRGPEFAELGKQVLQEMRSIFRTEHNVIMYPASGTGAWEAALTNTLSPGDRLLMAETGHFAALWIELARRFDLNPEVIVGDWRRGADPATIEGRLREDRSHQIKAVCVVHNETSTGCVTDIAAIRAAINAANHPALLMVDTISSLGSIDFQMDAWGVDVTIAGSQKGLMLPPGLSFNAVSPNALAAMESAALPRSYWSWQSHLGAIDTGQFPYTPATTLIYGLLEALAMLNEEGLENVFARHARHATATRKAIEAWGLELLCADPAAYSNHVVRHTDAAGCRRRQIPRHRPEFVRHVAWHRPRPTCGQSVSYRSPGIFQRSDAGRHVGRRRNGTGTRRCCVRTRRCAGGNRLSGGKLS